MKYMIKINTALCHCTFKTSSLPSHSLCVSLFLCVCVCMCIEAFLDVNIQDNFKML